MAYQNSRLMDLLDLSHVPRWVTFPVARTQSVAEHSYRVAILALEIRERLPAASAITISVAALLRWALMHDGPESKTGDIPAPLKRMLGSAAISDIENAACDWYEAELTAVKATRVAAIVHIADAMEALSWLSRYGAGFRDRFDQHDINDGLRRRIHEEARHLEASCTGAYESVTRTLGEIAP